MGRQLTLVLLLQEKKVPISAIEVTNVKTLDFSSLAEYVQQNKIATNKTIWKMLAGI